jgi:PTH1 family peptidyl-tRNA hydrolase
MIIFGLGNPGLKYRRTRHNAGYLFLEKLARTSKKRFAFKGQYRQAKLRIKNKQVYLVKPNCWMNQCGAVIHAVLHGKTHDFLVVLDDVNLPLGRIRLRNSGSDGGHLGLRSVIEYLQTDDFRRLRIGIGRPSVNTEDYVLEGFDAGEMRVLNKVFKHGVDGIRILMSDGFVKAQNYINSFYIEDIGYDSSS